jgi:hypothetical protein
MPEKVLDHRDQLAQCRLDPAAEVDHCAANGAEAVEVERRPQHVVDEHKVTRDRRATISSGSPARARRIMVGTSRLGSSQGP